VGSSPTSCFSWQTADLYVCGPDVEHDTTTKPTGQFNYTFSVPKDVKVMPHTYQEYSKHHSSPFTNPPPPRAMFLECSRKHRFGSRGRWQVINTILVMYIDARRRVKLGDIQTRQERSNSTQEQRQLAEDANLTE